MDIGVLILSIIGALFVGILLGITLVHDQNMYNKEEIKYRRGNTTKC